MSYSDETAHSINGVSGRLYARHLRSDAPHLFSAQKWVSESRPRPDYGPRAVMNVEIRFDDSYKNGHATFAITATIGNPNAPDCMACGCLHDEIAETFPELRHLIRWDLCSTDGPMHYVGNTCYHAGDRDHNGLRAGESRQIYHGGDKSKPCWVLLDENGERPPSAWSNSYSGPLDQAPPPPVLSWQPLLRHGEGKERNFDAARSCAAWPDATDAQLSLPREELEALLIARLPSLLADMRADMDAAGLLWGPNA